MRAEGAVEEYSPCCTLCDLTLINEGADMGRMRWREKGKPEDLRAPRRRAGR